MHIALLVSIVVLTTTIANADDSALATDTIVSVNDSAPSTDSSPLHFLFSKCPEPDVADGDIGTCARDLLSAALERDRSQFTTGVNLGTRTLVLEPLSLPDVQDKASSRPRWEVTQTRVRGLSGVRVESVLLTPRTAGILLSMPQLVASLQLTVRYGFLPLRPRMAVTLHQPKMLLAADWSADDEGDLLLDQVHAQLFYNFTQPFNATVKGVSSVGKSFESAMNDNAAGIVEFLKPSLEAAVVKRVTAMTQKQRNDMLQWLEKTLS